nr:ABC transporter substrate-binding protein [Campylobacter sp.]
MKKIILMILVLLSVAFGREFTDMSGRKVNLEANIIKAFGASPPMSAMLYMLAPNKMVGKNYEFLEIEKKFMLPQMINLPVLGGFFGGGGSGINSEKLILVRPQVIFLWDSMKNMSDKYEKDFEKFGISSVYLKQESIEDLYDSLNLMGEILGVQERAEKLIKIGKENINLVQKVVQKQKNSPKIYFAQGLDGLQTQCESERFFDVAKIAGAKNIHECKNKSNRPRIDLETLYAYDPDAIFVREEAFFEELKNPNSAWKNLRAYKNKNIFLEPSTPYSFLTRPPTPMRFLGVVWMCKMLYKDKCDINLNAKTKEFYKEFLHFDLDDEEISSLYKSF